MSSTPTLDMFLQEVRGIMREKNGDKLQAYLVIEPSQGTYPPLYNTMIAELRRSFPDGTEDALEDKCREEMPELLELEDRSSFESFYRFLAQYFVFLRDIDVQNLNEKQLEAYNLLAELVEKCTSALGHASMGIVVLPTSISCSRMLAKLAIILDKQPHLIAHMAQVDESSGEKETLPEKAAVILRRAFLTCLNDRSGSSSGIRDGRPDGKKSGIYTIANLCLKILFQCRKINSAVTIFTNIQNQSPPLSIYPRPERITYLYYLGRFHFTNNHFYRAQLALQSAFDQCPPTPPTFKQRRLILIYLLTSNIILGRFPTAHLYALPEAIGLAERFRPLTRAIAKGDLARFNWLLDSSNQHAAWFLHFRILFQLKNRCTVLVWRSLLRRTFLLAGDDGDPNSRKAPTVDLDAFAAVLAFTEKRCLDPTLMSRGAPQTRHPNWIYMSTEPARKYIYTDPDFEGLSDDEGENVVENGGAVKSVRQPILPDIRVAESIVSSLVDQGFLGGFVSHKQRRFAIVGAKRRGPLQAGFPVPWQAVLERVEEEGEEVPGWKRDIDAGMGDGRVVSLAGARPVGLE
ncbi:hypothetical protein K490DRAFT_52150 [Saccharata proteae CBS 121410]|uniref:PCI domain-containing protein n=1 Tax=Saccharata proteae CBS 121410 TaxID=1314787 RepID=A0A9P4LR67_9PEZI|nr:hypothetical protein K490DRAFT_52150 [Saccharata proteae CBS 121410]